MPSDFKGPDGIWNTEDDPPRLIIEEGSPIIDAEGPFTSGIFRRQRGVKRPQGKGWI